jgi:hypothetical protein
MKETPATNTQIKVAFAALLRVQKRDPAVSGAELTAQVEAEIPKVMRLWGISPKLAGRPSRTCVERVQRVGRYLKAKGATTYA